jgi:hypothetical protein
MAGLNSLPRHLPQPSQPWGLILRWQYLSGESKLAWLFLWQQLGCRPGTVTIGTGAVGDFQGTSDRAGRNSLEKLHTFGLIKIIDRVRGQWTVHVFDPVEVARARLIPGDGQGELEFEGSVRASADGDSPPEVSAQKPPEVCALKPPPPCNTTPTLNTPNSAQALHLQRHGRGGFSAETSAGLPMRTSGANSATVPDGIGGDVDAVVNSMPLRLAMMGQQKEQAEGLAARIEREIGDPTLYAEISLKVAWVVVEGKLPLSKVDDVLRRIKRLLREKPGRERGKYFIAAMEEVFREHGLNFKNSRRGSASPTQGGAGEAP